MKHSFLKRIRSVDKTLCVSQEHVKSGILQNVQNIPVYRGNKSFIGSHIISVEDDQKENVD